MANVGPFWWYGSSVGWTAVTAWATGTVTAAGALIRQNAAPTVGNERVFVCIVAGTTHATTEPTWTVTKGAKNTDNTVTWQECTGQPGVNGDTTNSPTWTQNKNTALSLGMIIYTAGTSSLQIVSTAGTTGNGSEPSFSGTAGTTTADNTVTWTSLGAASNFGRWAAPFARMQSMVASTWMTAATTNTGLWADNHAETQSSAMTITLPGSSNAHMTQMIAVDHTSSTPWTAPMNAVSATITTTGNSNLAVTTSSTTGFYLNGFQFSAGSGANSTSMIVSTGGTSYGRIANCKFIKAGTSANGSGAINFSSYGGALFIRNSTVKFASTGDNIRIAGGPPIEWSDTASWLDTGGSTPTSLLSVVGQANWVFRGIDLSAFGSGKTLVGPLSTNSTGTVAFHGCQLGSSVTIASTPSVQNLNFYLVNCDSTGSIARQEIYSYQGTLTAETTVVRTGGASDGITPISWKIVTTSNCRWAAPFVTFPRVHWNSTTGSSVTATVYGIWGGGAVPNNDDVWVVWEYFGTSGNPLYTIVNTTKTDPLASNAATTTDSSTWGGSTTAFKVSSSFTPQLAGYIRATVYVGAASTTVYIDPEIYLS